MSNVAAGKDIDDNGEKLNDVEKALNAQGIALRSAKGEWRSFEEVIDEVAGKWKKFNDTQRSQIATAIAGTRQQEIFRSLMNNYDQVGKLAQVAADSTGSASKRMEIYLNSVEAKTNNVKNAWQGLIQSLNQNESYGQMLDMLTNFLEKLQYVDWKEVGRVVELFITLFGLAKGATWIATGVASIKAATVGIAKIAAGLSAFAPMLVVILGLVVAIGVAVNSINDNYNKKIDDLDSHIDSIKKEKDALDEDKKSVQALYNEYTTLESKQKLIGLNADEKQKMADITKELVEQYGFEYSSVDSLTGGYNLATDALTKYTEAIKSQQKQLDEEERKDRIKKIAVANQKYLNNKKTIKTTSEIGKMDSFGFNQLGQETKTWGFWGSLGHEFEAYKDAFTGKGSGGFFERYDQSLQKQFEDEANSAKEEVAKFTDETVGYMMDVMGKSISNSGLSDRFNSLFQNQLKIGLQNVDATKLDTEEEVEKFISSYEKILSDSGLKNTESKVNKTLTEIEKKMADTSNAMNLEDYKKYNQALEQQAGISASLLSNIMNNDKAVEIAMQSLKDSLSNTGSYFALISDSIKDDKIKSKFDNIANGIININDQLADGRINIEQYFNTMKSQIESIDLSHIEDSFGNIGNYLATMGQVTNSAGGQLQSIIADMQQGKKLNNAGVDDIKTISNLFGTVYNSILSSAKDEAGNWKSYKYQSGTDKDGNPVYSQGTLQKYFEDSSATDQKALDTLQQKQNTIKNELSGAKEALQNLKNIKEGKAPTTSQNIKTPSTQTGNSTYNRQTKQSSVLDGINTNNVKVTKPNVYNQPLTNSNDIYLTKPDGTSIKNKQASKENDEKEKTKAVNSEIIKQEGKIASLEQEQKDVEKDISDEKNKVNKGMTSYLKDLSKGVDYLDSFDWDSLDKSSDTLFQGFSDGALNATSTIDNVNKEYKDAAMNMASNFQEMTGQIGNSLDGLNDNVKNSLTKIGEETLNQIGLTSGATTEQIANAMLSSNSNFNAVVGAMNKSAQEALSEVLKGAGGMLEALGSAIESFSGEIKISIGGVKFNGLKTFTSWDGGELFSSTDKPVETSIKFSGSGIDTKSLGTGIREAGASLKNNAEALASQWNPIQPNLIDTKGGNTGGKSNYTPSGGGSKKKKGSGSDYSAEDAASDLKDILNDIEKYEAEIELDLEDQTEELLNQYNLKKNQLDTLKEELDYYDSIYDVTENTTKWLDTQLKILDNQSKKVAEMQNSNEKIDKQRQKIYNENSKYNVKSWFDSEGNETLAYGDLLNSFEYRKNQIEKETADAMRAEYNKVANSTNKDTIKAAKDKIKQIEEEGDTKIKLIDKERTYVENVYDSVEQLNDAWKENQEAIREALQELNDRVKSIRDELIDDIMEQLEKAVDKMNKSLDKDVTRLEQLKEVQQSYNDILNDTIDTQQELEDELKANMDSYQYLDDTMRQLMFNEDDYKQLSGVIEGIQSDIAGIWEDHYNQIQNLTEDEMYKAEYITAETERQLAVKQKEYDLAKAELDVAKAQTNLNNVKNERNTRIFANGEWQWVANAENVRNAQQQLMEAEREKTKLEREAEQQLLINAMDKMIDSDNLQIDKNNELLENIQEAIEQETQEVKSIEEALMNADKANLPALTNTLIGALGSDGGYMKELLGEINHSQVELAAALRGQTIQQAVDQLKSGTMSQSDFEELTKRLGYSFNETTGMVTTQDGSFAAHYRGWTKKSNNATQLGTAQNGVQTTGGNAGAGQASAATSGGNGGGSTFPRNGRVSTSSLPLRIRSGAGTQYRILGTMPKGANVTILGESNSGWAQVRYGGITGYASRQYLSYDQGGIANGLGYMPKATLEPERVLSPRQTKAFEKLVNNITTNPVLNALSRVPSVNSKLGNLAGETNNSKNYYFSNFTVQADDIKQFINSIETIMPMKNK